MSLVPVREAARGRWKGILSALGIDSRFLQNKNGPCPMCQGKDRWRFDDRDGRGTWICSHCGAGDGIQLVMAAKGLEFQAAAVEVENLVGSARIEPARPERSDADKMQAMRRLWNAAKPIVPIDPAGLWLRRRVGLTSFPKSLRYAPAVRHEGGCYPCMLAVMRAPDGSGSILHRTFLTMDGRKADVPKPRMLMQGKVTLGSAVRLFDIAPELGIAEGIETAFAAASLFGVPTWAALNADCLAKWIPPSDTITSVVVFGDTDASFTGQAAAFTLARRLRNLGIEVRVELPTEIGTDWNDVWLRSEQLA